MLVLASMPRASKKQKIVAAYTIGEENAQEIECTVCMEEHEDEELFICPGSDSSLHALHWGCLRKSEAKDKDYKKLCPGCTKNWEAQLMSIRTKAVKDLVVHCSKFEDAPESVNKILRRAPGAAELREILLQTVGNFEDLSKIHEEFQGICKRLLKAYAPLSQIYDGAPGKSTLEKTISEMDNAFEELKEDKIRVLPEGYQLLVNAPKNIYTENIIYFMSTPIFFARLDPKQIIDLGKHLFIFARDDASFEKTLADWFITQYIYHNSDTLNSDALEELLDLTEGPTRLEKIQQYILGGLMKYGFSAKLSPGCCEKLAKIVLMNPRTNIMGKLYVLRELGFSTDFTKEMRDRVIDCWKERGIGEDDERALEILHLKDSDIESQRNLNDKAFELLERIW